VSEHNFSAMKAAMIASQLRTNSVSDPRVLAVLDAVRREDFVPEGRRALAYVDIPIPLGGGRVLNAPLVTARLLVEAELAPGEKVLLIGGCTGYAAALIAALGNAVVSVESNTAMSLAAAKSLAGNALVKCITGPMAAGSPEDGPFDLLFIDGAVAHVQAGLVAQLREGGRIVTCLVENGVIRLAVGQKRGGTASFQSIVDMEAAILPEFITPSSFSF
jgi:protein-L-isoaspartate(D-aspartate) O-methyltransferase